MGSLSQMELTVTTVSETVIASICMELRWENYHLIGSTVNWQKSHHHYRCRSSSCLSKHPRVA